MKTILFQGDSITDAGRSRENDTNPGIGHALLIKGELEYAYPQQYYVINRGVCGNRVVDLYARIKNDLINLRPDVVSILIGVNDVWHEFSSQNGVDAEKYFKIYCMLIEEIQEELPDTQIMIMEPFVLKAGSTEKRWDEFHGEVVKRAEKAKKVAEKYNLIFVPLQDAFDAAAERAANSHWLADGVHPTTAGYELIKREWMKGFQNLTV